jgi:hypothetical protein
MAARGALSEVAADQAASVPPGDIDFPQASQGVTDGKGAFGSWDQRDACGVADSAQGEKVIAELAERLRVNGFGMSCVTQFSVPVV